MSVNLIVFIASCFFCFVLFFNRSHTVIHLFPLCVFCTSLRLSQSRHFSSHFLFFLNALPPSQTLHLPWPQPEVVALSRLPHPLLLLPLPPPRPVPWTAGRRRSACCPPCWRTRPGGSTARRPSCSSAWPWVSGPCDGGWAHTSHCCCSVWRVPHLT